MAFQNLCTSLTVFSHRYHCCGACTLSDTSNVRSHRSVVASMRIGVRIGIRSEQNSANLPVGNVHHIRTAPLHLLCVFQCPILEPAPSTTGFHTPAHWHPVGQASVDIRPPPLPGQWAGARLKSACNFAPNVCLYFGQSGEQPLP